MKKTATVLRAVVGIAGAIQIALGIAFWTGNADPLVPVHILIGLILVFALWALAAIALGAGIARGLATLTAIWGFLTPALGLAQTRLLPGGSHWVIQVIHLLVGLTAIGLGQTLAKRIQDAAGSTDRHELGSMV